MSAKPLAHRLRVAHLYKSCGGSGSAPQREGGQASAVIRLWTVLAKLHTNNGDHERVVAIKRAAARKLT